MKEYAKRHTLVYKLTAGDLYKLKQKSCTFCFSKDTNKTYQNVGLIHHSEGFISKNVFPLCKTCYRTRYGMKLKKYKSHAKRITSYIESATCKTYRKTSLNCKPFIFCTPMLANCVYCGGNAHLTLDRIDSKKCYSKSNVQVLCKTCNRMKSNLSSSVFIKHMKRVSI